MKITQELENKIRNCVDKKYAEEAKKLRTELDETKARKSEFYADLAETIAKEHPEFEVFFTSYRRTIREGAKSIFLDKIVHEDLDVKEAVEKLANLVSKKKEEIENFTIKISYGKTFDDIKATFAEYGMDF